MIHKTRYASVIAIRTHVMVNISFHILLLTVSPAVSYVYLRISLLAWIMDRIRIILHTTYKLTSANTESLA
jgi:hypothetical protein